MTRLRRPSQRRKAQIPNHQLYPKRLRKIDRYLNYDRGYKYGS